MISLKHGDRVRINGKKGHVGTVGGYASQYDENPVDRIEQARAAGHPLTWVNQDPAILSSDPGHREAQQEYWASAIELKDGQPVWLEGEVLKVKYKGNYADMVEFVEVP